MEGYGFKRVAFADKVKEAALAIDPWIPASSRYPHIARLSELVEVMGMEQAKTIAEVRRLIQRVGAEAGWQLHGETLWIDAVRADVLHSASPVVLTDVRLPHEAEFVRSLATETDGLVKGYVVRIEREGAGLGAGSQHATEAHVAGLCVDAEIVNNDTPEQVAAAVLAALGLFEPRGSARALS